jgi:hypothetical protein
MTKDAEERVALLRDEIQADKKALEEMNSSVDIGGNSDDAAKYELLVKRDQEMSAFMDQFDDV